jgi:CheY-like chemotaxis protein
MASIRPGRAVLVVEDAISIRSMLSEFFIGHGYDVLHARHPDVALKRLNSSGASIDAVILDVHLDDNRSGLEVLELIRLDERFIDLTVVILTAHAPLDHEDVETIHRNRAHLLYKQQGCERVFERLEGIVKPLTVSFPITEAPAPPGSGPVNPPPNPLRRTSSKVLD